MLAARDFWDDAAIARVDIHLGGDHRRELGAAVTDNSRGCFVA
jgi:hypothetical protein